MKMMRFVVVALSIALAACGSQSQADTDAAKAKVEKAAAVAAERTADAPKSPEDKAAKPTAAECDAKLTAEARSDCQFDRVMTLSTKSSKKRPAPAPVVDPLLGKPLDQAASSSTAPSNAGTSH
ncbi:hypothetical protein RKE25_23065 (plasmid) [Dyella sp. BiH032]|uniref:hypothetical protein n=1 Tax=Dyella sp. BiH032 TaxID=3075430 RepID=UPI002892D42C|nr:hypothetical protein [Dyella sp. BiH032]WNL48566.1 hypothetical protein RKE25_23065 [Dyella sp. BiH032]